MVSPAKKRLKAAAEAAAAANIKSEASAADQPSTSTTTTSSISALLAQSTSATSTLSALLDEIETSVTSPSLSPLLTSSSTAFLLLKSTQRNLCLSVESGLVEEVTKARERLGGKTLELQNLVYERDYLRGRVRECRDFGCVQLVKMARDEMKGSGGDDDKEGDHEKGEDHEGQDEKLINEFLSSRSTTAAAVAEYDHRDPSNHQTNIATLKTELTLRRKVETDLTKARSELGELKKHCSARKTFLASLPRKLKEVERSTGPLQNFFREAVTGGSDGGGGGDIKPAMLIGTDRSARIEAARNLPEPLYTVFLQLSGYATAFASTTTNTTNGSGSNNIKIEIMDEAPSGKAAAIRGMDGTEDAQRNAPEAWIVRHDKVVALSIPIPDIDGLSSSSGAASSSSSYVTIKFRYLPRLGVVTASASGSGEEGRILLAGLFPDDDGTTLPSCAAPFLVGEDSYGKDKGSNIATATAEALAEVEALLMKRGDLPYCWCQFVSGLLFPPPPSSHPGDSSSQAEGEYDDHHQPKRGTIEPSTRSVVRSLTRRIRARTTLTALLNTLCRGKTPPVHSALNGGDAKAEAPSSRLTGWTETSGNDKSCKYYVATIKRNTNGSTAKATVKIDPSYPAPPPLWSLQPATANLDEAVGADGWGEREGNAISLHDPSSSSPSPPLYDPVMGGIEDAINADLASLVVDGVEDTYDWILSAQVGRLLECFDNVQDGGSASAAGVGRRVVGYDLYSKGL